MYCHIFIALPVALCRHSTDRLKKAILFVLVLPVVYPFLWTIRNNGNETSIPQTLSDFATLVSIKIH